MDFRRGFLGIAIAAMTITACTDQQILSTLETADAVLNGEGAAAALGEQEIIDGLKEALSVGTDNAAGLASAVGGFNDNPIIHIPFPEDAIKVKNTVEDLGMKPQVDRFVGKLNEAAEQASREAAPIFLDAILTMSIQDGMTILKGEQDAATAFLREKTYDRLYSAFQPKVETAISEVEVGKHWTPLANAYNTASLFAGNTRIDPDLNNYVTTKAIDGLFTLLADEEKKIRENPAARVTNLLKKVFGSLDG